MFKKKFKIVKEYDFDDQYNIDHMYVIKHSTFPFIWKPSGYAFSRRQDAQRWVDERTNKS